MGNDTTCSTRMVGHHHGNKTGVTNTYTSDNTHHTRSLLLYFERVPFLRDAMGCFRIYDSRFLTGTSRSSRSINPFVAYTESAISDRYCAGVKTALNLSNPDGLMELKSSGVLTDCENGITFVGWGGE